MSTQGQKFDSVPPGQWANKIWYKKHLLIKLKLGYTCIDKATIHAL